MTNLVAATWRGAEKLLRRWGGGILIVNMLLASALGLMWLDSRVIRPGRMLGSPERPGSGVVVRSEVVHLWLPETIIGLAERQSEYMIAKKHEELQAYLESRGQANLWYAITYRGQQVNGAPGDITYIRQPYREPEHFREFLDVLKRVDVATPREPDLPYLAAEVHVLTKEQWERDPREVLAELLPQTGARSDEGR